MQTEVISNPFTGKIDSAQLQKKFDALKANANSMALSTAGQRKALLKKLLQSVLAHREEIIVAMKGDYSRNAVETELAETWVVVKEIKFAIRHLSYWMSPKRVPTSIAFFGARAQINYEAKGVALIIAPWNFPFNLSLAPLVSAIAAGNTVLIKPSEFTPQSSALIKKIVEKALPPNVAWVEEGGLALSEALLALPFNHIFFTGSPNVGKIVMKAAANHHASVTLELGGKSPTVVDAGVHLAKTAAHVLYSKLSNNGQVCIATDFVLVHEKIKDQFIEEAKLALHKMFPAEGLTENKDYARVVDKRHFQRLQSLVDDAVEKGATLCTPMQIDSENRFIAPVILAGITAEMAIASEEIFGPVLPIKTFVDEDDLMTQLRQGEKPLALHVFTNNTTLAKKITHEISAGAIVVNETFLHHFNSHLPFGGINNSGMGKSHGHFGFFEFTNQKAVVVQWSPWRISALLRPPYGKFSKFITDFLIRYIS